MDEQKVWLELQSGSQLALKILYEHYFNLLVNYGLRISLNRELVEDSIQDLFIDLWNMHPRLGKTDSVKNYLFSSFRRNLIRKLKSRLTTVELTGYQEENISESSNFINNLIHTEEDSIISKKLVKAIDNLTVRQKEVIYLRYNQGLEYEQICEIMDLKYQSVRNLVSDAIIKLKENIALSLIFIQFNEYILSFLYF